MDATDASEKIERENGMICALSDQPITRVEDDVILGGGDCHVHIESLVRNYIASGKMSDPFTGTDLPHENLQRIYVRFAAQQRRGVLVDCSINECSLQLNGLDTIGNTILEILRRTGSVIDVTQFDVQLNKQSLYEQDLNMDLDVYLSGISTAISVVDSTREYFITCSKGLDPLHLQKMHTYITTSGDPDLAKRVAEELTNGTVMQIV